MEDRTCPFCGGVQSESRCEICGRPTVKILQQHSAVMTKRYPHPYQEPKQNVQKSAQNHIDNPYLKNSAPAGLCKAIRRCASSISSPWLSFSSCCCSS